MSREEEVVRAGWWTVSVAAAAASGVDGRWSGMSSFSCTFRTSSQERTQASFAKSGKMMAAHANAFSFGGPKSKEEVAKEKKQRASEVSKEEAAKAKKKYG